jgi:hypothetical protein
MYGTFLNLSMFHKFILKDYQQVASTICHKTSYGGIQFLSSGNVNPNANSQF